MVEGPLLVSAASSVCVCRKRLEASPSDVGHGREPQIPAHSGATAERRLSPHVRRSKPAQRRSGSENDLEARTERQLSPFRLGFLAVAENGRCHHPLCRYWFGSIRAFYDARDRSRELGVRTLVNVWSTYELSSRCVGSLLFMSKPVDFC